VDHCDICQNLLDHLAAERRGYSLVLEELDPVLTSSLVKDCSMVATRGAESSR
jgi:hypothetical protein